MLRKQNKNHIS